MVYGRASEEEVKLACTYAEQALRQGGVRCDVEGVCGFALYSVPPASLGHVFPLEARSMRQQRGEAGKGEGQTGKA